MRHALPITFVVVLSACGAATDDRLRARAAFDLQCNASSLKLTPLDSRTKGVEGCGQRVTYVEQCEYLNGLPTSCTWVLNTDSRSLPRSNGGAVMASPPPAPPPPPAGMP